MTLDGMILHLRHKVSIRAIITLRLVELQRLMKNVFFPVLDSTSTSCLLQPWFTGDSLKLRTLLNHNYFKFYIRDSYPRTKQIRWKFVAKNYMEVVAVIFIFSLISERIMYPVYNQFGSQFYEVGVKELLASVFNSMLPGLLCFLCGFYCILHSWMNAAAEILRWYFEDFLLS